MDLKGVLGLGHPALAYVGEWMFVLVNSQEIAYIFFMFATSRSTVFFWLGDTTVK